MKDNVSPLFSRYVLDGTPMEDTPFSALYDCLDGNGTVKIPEKDFGQIEDVYHDKMPVAFEFDEALADTYVQSILQCSRKKNEVNLDYTVCWTRSAINGILLDQIFKDGHFTLQDILLMAKWDWRYDPSGNLAAFYDSTVTAGRQLCDLNVRLDRYFIEKNHRGCFLDLSVRSKIAGRLKCGGTMSGSPSDWIIYIPFCNGRYNLGGSALSEIEGNGSGIEPDLSDSGYFADCFEVVRELVEDGIVVAGTQVGYGGLLTAAERFRGRNGLTMDIGGIMASRKENDAIKILFAEIPGVIVQIKDRDYDYLDSQLMLQEVVYFPLGHPDLSLKEINVSKISKNNVAGILESLLNQASEGED